MTLEASLSAAEVAEPATEGALLGEGVVFCVTFLTGVDMVGSLKC